LDHYIGCASDESATTPSVMVQGNCFPDTARPMKSLDVVKHRSPTSFPLRTT
jgi:hypothetical protein